MIRAKVLYKPVNLVLGTGKSLWLEIPPSISRDLQLDDYTPMVLAEHRGHLILVAESRADIEIVTSLNMEES